MIGLTARVGRVGYQHLADLSDGRGIYEHALGAAPRPEHGYCLDDVARAFTVVVRAQSPTEVMRQLAETYLRFMEDAIGADGAAHNRMSADGTWTDERRMGDWWGRAIGALGAGVQSGAALGLDVRSARAFARAAAQNPVDVRTAAFAAIGAADVLRSHRDSPAARRVIATALTILPSQPVDGWNWPESRLRYANATLAEALLAAGHVTGDRNLLRRALGFLDFLLAAETRDGHLSVTGTDGRGPEDVGPFFDQQAIEVSAMADGCARAFALTRDRRWFRGVALAWSWFEGANDVGLPMFDEVSGAGFDGLEPGGRNDNRGAESTLAALNTFQRASELGIVGNPGTRR